MLRCMYYAPRYSRERHQEQNCTANCRSNDRYMWSWQLSLTVVWDDGPGHGRGVNPSNHPEHAEPAQMLSSLLSSQHLRKEGRRQRSRWEDGPAWRREGELLGDSTAEDGMIQSQGKRVKQTHPKPDTMRQKRNML
ncbi:hypothetical protein INR49_030681 [Caranx melampygus]|nr:hypothetical protein INR49_030681 [Caranx melampygus]